MEPPTLSLLADIHARTEAALSEAQAQLADALVHVRRLEDELARQGLNEAEIAAARNGQVVPHRSAQRMTAESFLSIYGEAKLVTVIALFQRGANAAEVGRLFGVSRETARHWRDALLCVERRWIPHPDVAALAEEKDAELQVVA